MVHLNQINAEELRQSVIKTLKPRHAMEASALRGAIGASENDLETILDELESEDVVSVLRPVSNGQGERQASTFYRLRTPRDRDYLWHQQIHERPTIGRMIDVLQYEGESAASVP